MGTKDKGLRELLERMADPRRDALLQIYDDLAELFHHAAGSSHNHQAWPGGYADHIAECLRINTVTYAALNGFRELPFTEDSAAICLFFHDIEKPFRYGPMDDPNVAYWHQWIQMEGLNDFAEVVDLPSPPTWKWWEKAKWEILKKLSNQYGLVLTGQEVNALLFTHGEGSAHKKDQRVAGPLAAHVHHCDNTSARIYFDDGKGLDVSQNGSGKHCGTCHTHERTSCGREDCPCFSGECEGWLGSSGETTA